MGETAPHPDSDHSSASRSLAARDAGGVMLGLAALLEHRSFDDTVDPRLVETTIRRLRRVGGELLVADEDDRTDGRLATPPDGIAWATQLSWLLSRSRSSGPVSGSLHGA